MATKTSDPGLVLPTRTEQERTYVRKFVRQSLDKAVNRANRNVWRLGDVEVIVDELVKALRGVRRLHGYLTQEKSV